jgi:Meiotically Up-regulated Gene 113 (MUG113) protein/uncharacterized protein DUF4041
VYRREVSAPNDVSEGSGSNDGRSPVPTSTPAPTATPPVESPPAVGFFGARKRARELTDEVVSLQAVVDSLRTECERLRESQDRLGVLSVVQLEQRRDALAAEIDEQRRRLEAERADARRRLEDETATALAGRHDELARLERECVGAGVRLHELKARVVVTEETEVLQEVGVYEYRHPLSDSVAYQSELKRLRDQIKAMTRKDGGAVLAITSWTVNGSAAQGRTMVRDFSKLMLRAYNAEADTLVRSLKPYKLATAVDRLTKVTTTIAKLGKTMDIRIAVVYHQLRVRELELTADYLEKLAEEKEREREEKERLREERRAQQEMERERARLEKERQHYQNALAALIAKGDTAGTERLQAQLGDIDRAIEDVDYRAANIRAGYVYVISNVGAFGDRIVKIGMTRRLEPMDRVRELGDASVPFRFDVHALFFSDDAVGIETSLHRRLAERRVNRVNLRREFFYATPEEVRTHLVELTGELLQYDDFAEAVEFRQSQAEVGGGGSGGAGDVLQRG